MGVAPVFEKMPPAAAAVEEVVAREGVQGETVEERIRRPVLDEHKMRAGIGDSVLSFLMDEFFHQAVCIDLNIEGTEPA